MNATPTKTYQACISACNTCADACDHCAASCLAEHDVTAMADCIALDIDCSAACRLAASFMARNSGFSVALCRLCADICRACATQCARHPMDHCQACAQACRDCVAQCERMAQ